MNRNYNQQKRIDETKNKFREANKPIVFPKFQLQFTDPNHGIILLGIIPYRLDAAKLNQTRWIFFNITLVYNSYDKK